MDAADADRLAQFEARLLQLESDVARLRADAPVPWIRQPPPPRTTDLAPGAPPAPIVGPTPERSVEWWSPDAGARLTREAVLKWSGIALIVLAVGFALSTAIRRGWLGPELQLLAAATLGIALQVAGWRVRESRSRWTGALLTAGIWVEFTTVASNLFGQHVGDPVPFVCVVAVALLGVALAQRAPSEMVAAGTLIGGASAWLVISEGSPDFAFGLAWIAAAVALTLWQSLDNEWLGLRAASHAIGLGWLLRQSIDADSIGERTGFVVVSGMLFLSLLLLPSRGSGHERWRELDIQLAMLGPPWMIIVMIAALDVASAGPRAAVSFATVAGTLVATTLLRRSLTHRHLLSLVLGSSVGLSIGLANLLNVSATFVAFAVQAAGLMFLARRLGYDLRVVTNALLLAAASTTYVGSEVIEAWRVDATWAHDVAHLVIIVAIGATGWSSPPRWARKATALGLLVSWLAWTMSVLVHLPQGHAIVSGTWAGTGMALVASGTRNVHARIAPLLPAATPRQLAGGGLAVIMLTVAKLLTIDLREVDTLWRAALFLAVGLGVLRLGYLLPRLDEPAVRDGGR